MINIRRESDGFHVEINGTVVFKHTIALIAHSYVVWLGLHAREGIEFGIC